MPEPMQRTFDVVVGKTDESPGDTYTFRIPSIGYDMEMAYKATDVRMRAYPAGMGALGGLDGYAMQFARCCAMLELYLVKATTGWPFGIADDGDLSGVDFAKPPEIRFENFPLDRTQDVYDVGEAFETELRRFRVRGNKPGQPAGA